MFEGLEEEEEQKALFLWFLLFCCGRAFGVILTLVFADGLEDVLPREPPPTAPETRPRTVGRRELEDGREEGPGRGAEGPSPVRREQRGAERGGKEGGLTTMGGGEEPRTARKPPRTHPPRGAREGGLRPHLPSLSKQGRGGGEGRGGEHWMSFLGSTPCRRASPAALRPLLRGGARAEGGEERRREDGGASERT